MLRNEFFISEHCKQTPASADAQARNLLIIQTVTVGTGFAPVQRLRGRGLKAAAITAGGDFHPALKMNDSIVSVYYILALKKCKRFLLYKKEYLFYN